MVGRTRPSRFTIIAELFGVLTAVAFVASGIINGVLFYMNWKLNYFLIASPSDVVMTGFIFVSAIVVFLAIFGLCVGLVSLVIGEVKGGIERAGSTLGSFFRTLTDEQREQLGLMVKATDRFVQRALILSFGVTSTVAGAAIAFGLTQTTEVPTTRPEAGGEAGPLQFSYVTGLRLSPEAKVDKSCWAAPVLWMGNDRAVIGCRDGVKVIGKMDEVMTQAATVPLPQVDGGPVGVRQDSPAVGGQTSGEMTPDPLAG